MPWVQEWVSSFTVRQAVGVSVKGGRDLLPMLSQCLSPDLSLEAANDKSGAIGVARVVRNKVDAAVVTIHAPSSEANQTHVARVGANKGS